ncbi:MAG: hypothetical protein IKP81_06600 [Paludibacteraceae bacterium]|nr:hypothetical protein [Paludibacteraceae bacterium]
MGRYLRRNKWKLHKAVEEQHGAERQKVLEQQNGDAQRKVDYEQPETIHQKAEIKQPKRDIRSRWKDAVLEFFGAFLAIPFIVFLPYQVLDGIRAIGVINHGTVVSGVVEEHNYIRSSKIKVLGEVKTLYQGGKNSSLQWKERKGDFVKVLTKENCPVVVCERDCTMLHKVGIYFSIIICGFLSIVFLCFFLYAMFSTLKEIISPS